jgi:glycine/D-amino acid oxidase-like deaminating enzyme/nitrite reductase/ring-hydroxylating ferredoxin subunit
MAAIPEAALVPNVSYWIESTPSPRLPALESDAACDVAVVGAGVVGLTAAALLHRDGRRPCVLEAKQAARGVSGYTTAKVTAGHGLAYSTLERRHGVEAALLYARSQTAALALVRSLVSELALDCELEEARNVVFDERPDGVPALRREAAAAARAGLPARFVADAGLPFATAGAVELDEQLQFHPRRYLLGLLAHLREAGVPVYERSPAVGIEWDGADAVVRTPAASVRARDVVLATHAAFLDRSFLFARVHPRRAYVVAGRAGAEVPPDGMFIAAGEAPHSIRTAPAEPGRLLLVGGEGHATGRGGDTAERYRRLERWAADRLGLEAVEHRWSTQDGRSVDGLPFVGRLARALGGVWVATGFDGWGMSNGTMAAALIADGLAGRERSWARLYDPNRLRPFAAAGPFLRENAAVARELVGGLARVRDGAGPLAPGEARVMRCGGRRVALHRRADGELLALSAACTHMGCTVAWNEAEETWDCPCHGSRFLADGRVVEGPAVRALEPVDPPPDSG